MTIEWKSAYKIGDVEIDAQHERLFAMANAFVTARDKSALTAGAMSLYKYTREHFSHEEKLMRALDYPGIVGHIRQHDDLITRLNSVAASIADSTLPIEDLESFLRDWLLGHIRFYDTKLAAYVKARNND